MGDLQSPLIIFPSFARRLFGSANKFGAPSKFAAPNKFAAPGKASSPLTQNVKRCCGTHKTRQPLCGMIAFFHEIRRLARGVAGMGAFNAY